MGIISRFFYKHSEYIHGNNIKNENGNKFYYREKKEKLINKQFCVCNTINMIIGTILLIILFTKTLPEKEQLDNIIITQCSVDTFQINNNNYTRRINCTCEVCNNVVHLCL